MMAAIGRRLERRLERGRRLERRLERGSDEVGPAARQFGRVVESVRQFGQVVEMFFGHRGGQMAMLGPRYNRSNLLEAEK